MDIKNVSVVIDKVYEQQSGVSQNGNEWRSLLFEANSVNHGQYEKNAIFKLFGKKLDEFEQYIKEGATVTISFSVEFREWNGKQFHEINVFNVIPGTVTQQQATAPEQPQQAPAQDMLGDDSGLPF